jgi:hypothetical protein
MKKVVHISGFVTGGLLLAGCGSVGESLTSPWSYEKKIDPVTKLVTHESVASLSPEGSVTGNSTVVVSLLCGKEGDPASLFLEVATFDGKDTSAESALEMGGAINLRFNGAVIGPIEREGTEFFNISKWSVAVLNLVPLFDAFKNLKEFAPALAIAGVGQAFGLGDLTQNSVHKITMMSSMIAGSRFDKASNISALIGPYQHRIWAEEFVFSASTSAADLSASVSLSDPLVKKTVEACGFTYGPAPEKIEGANVQDRVEARTEDHFSNDSEEYADAAPAEAAEAAPSEEDAAAPAEAAEAAPVEEL